MMLDDFRRFIERKHIVKSDAVPFYLKWKLAIEQMVTLMRLKHLAYRTEQKYVGLMRSITRYLWQTVRPHLF